MHAYKWIPFNMLPLIMQLVWALLVPPLCAVITARSGLILTPSSPSILGRTATEALLTQIKTLFLV